MTFDWLLWIRDGLWLYLAAPLLLLAGLWLSLRLKFPQVTQFASAVRALRSKQNEGDGAMPAAATAMWTSAGIFAAASIVGAATSVALGGPGALVWVWVWTFVLAPLRIGESLLARTSAPGSSAANAPTSLVARLRGEKNGGMWAIAIAIFVAVAAIGFGGGSQGTALRSMTLEMAPGALLPLGVVATVVAAALAIAGAKRVGVLGAWAGLFCLAVIFIAALLAAFSEPHRAIGAFSRAVTDAIEGAPTVSAFTGALASEVARAALTYTLLPLVSMSGVAGSIDATSRASTKSQAHAAMLPSFVFALLSTVLGLAFVSTGAYSRATTTARPLSELSVYEIAFESPSQRLETDRLRTGPMRIRAGEMRDTSLVFATERGVVTGPTFTYYGAPADLAIDYRDGKPEHLARYQGLALGEIPLTQADQILVHGEMLPAAATLLMRATSHSALRNAGSQLIFAALLLLTVLASAGFGLGLARVVEAFSKNVLASRIASVLPALALGVATLTHAPSLGAMGEVACAISASLVALALIMRSAEIAKRLT